MPQTQDSFFQLSSYLAFDSTDSLVRCRSVPASIDTGRLWRWPGLNRPCSAHLAAVLCEVICEADPGISQIFQSFTHKRGRSRGIFLRIRRPLPSAASPRLPASPRGLVLLQTPCFHYSSNHHSAKSNGGEGVRLIPMYRVGASCAGCCEAMEW